MTHDQAIESLRTVRAALIEIERARAELETQLTEALAIARELARLATNMQGNPIGSVGTQVAMLEALEERIIEQATRLVAMDREREVKCVHWRKA